MLRVYRFVLFFSLSLLFLPNYTIAKEENEDIPEHVLPIERENTYSNEPEDDVTIEPSFQTKDLLDSIDDPIDNLELIKLLNETSIRPTPFSFGYRGEVYLGRWPIHYESKETKMNWEYQKVNETEISNFGTNATQSIVYEQQEEREVKGALMSQIANPDSVKRMMVQKVQKKTNLPLAFSTMIGKGTKTNHSYQVPPEKHGVLTVYVPAAYERGQITFGEVYVELKGTKKSLIIKNVTKQNIGAWIPVQDYVSFSLSVK